MAKKKQTLPKNFEELIENKDIENLKKVFETCELDARGGYAKSTALGFYSLPHELVRWLVQNGADINAVDIYECTALHKQANARRGDVSLLLEVGANVHAKDSDGSTALHFAASHGFNVDAVKRLIEHGANTSTLDEDDRTPLESALILARNTDLVNLVEISRMLLGITPEITPEMKASVIRRGEDFEFHRENFNKDYLQETDEALNKLYEIYGVPPVKKRIVHDGKSTIIVKGETLQKQFEELWELLIPSGGPAKTAQGEVVRIAGRVRDEINRNGGVNWNSDYRKMLDAYFIHISSGTPLNADDLKKADLIIKELRKNGNGNDDSLNFLCDLATKWVILNPEPILLDKPAYKR